MRYRYISLNLVGMKPAANGLCVVLKKKEQLFITHFREINNSFAARIAEPAMALFVHRIPFFATGVVNMYVQVLCHL